ncbi:hypothetical protein Y710_18350 [Gordonia sp. QH-12]|nr:hypothetical protein CXX93_17085 [Gordonia sp. YC-JH1]KXT55635.1 hypothetical protein Y710_18350 [Gordonia sp. QH-12]
MAPPAGAAVAGDPIGRRVRRVDRVPTSGAPGLATLLFRPSRPRPASRPVTAIRVLISAARR